MFTVKQQLPVSDNDDVNFGPLDRMSGVNEEGCVLRVLIAAAHNAHSDQDRALVERLRALPARFEPLVAYLRCYRDTFAEQIKRDLEVEQALLAARHLHDGEQFWVLPTRDGLQAWDTTHCTGVNFENRLHRMVVRRKPHPCEDIKEPWLVEVASDSEVGAPFTNIWLAAQHGHITLRQVAA